MIFYHFLRFLSLYLMIGVVVHDKGLESSLESNRWRLAGENAVQHGRAHPTKLMNYSFAGDFGRAARPLTPIELNGQLNWPKQTIHRLWQPMIENSLLEHQNERLQLTRTMEMAASLTHLTVNRTICPQTLVRIAREVGEIINFVRP